MKQHRPHNPIRLLLFTSLLLAFCAPTLASDDDYLRALEGEANNTKAETVGSDNYLDALSEEAEASAHVAEGRQAPAKEQAELEGLLAKEKPTTFKYYKKLKPWDKKKVVEYYFGDSADKTAKLGHLRKKILDLYFQH